MKERLVTMIFEFQVYNQTQMRTLTSFQQVLTVSGFINLFAVMAVLILTVFAVPSLAVPAQTGLNNEQLEDLREGKILLENIHKDKPGAAMRATVLLHTDADQIWNIIGNCEYEFVYIRGLKLCEVLSGDNFQMKVRHRLQNSWYSPTLDYIFQASRDEDGTGKASLVSGNLKVLEGQWDLITQPDGRSVIVAHEIRIQSRLPAPKWLLRRALDKDLPDMMACIRGLARASGDVGQNHRDLNRCAGDVEGLVK